MLAAERRGVEALRFNTEDYPVAVRVVADPLAPDSAQLLMGGDAIALGQARGIWLRRPRWPQVNPAVTDPLDRLFAQQEAIAAIGGVWRLLGERCVSPPDVMQAARWKMAQLRAAQAVGLNVPRTLVTNDPAAAREFEAAGRVVAKAVAEARVETPEAARVGETVEVSARDDLDGVLATPVLFQHRVDKVADVRVTAVGSRLFGVRIVTPRDAPVDFRVTDPAACEYAVVDLPGAIAGRLRAYLNRFGLRFGAFDLAEDRDGTLWFLECNPAGQWAWLEPPTGLDITAALVDLLLDPAVTT